MAERWDATTRTWVVADAPSAVCGVCDQSVYFDGRSWRSTEDHNRLHGAPRNHHHAPALCRNVNHDYFVRHGIACDCAITSRVVEGQRVDCTLREARSE